MLSHPYTIQSLLPWRNEGTQQLVYYLTVRLAHHVHVSSHTSTTWFFVLGIDLSIPYENSCIIDEIPNSMIECSLFEFCGIRQLSLLIHVPLRQRNRGAISPTSARVIAKKCISGHGCCKLFMARLKKLTTRVIRRAVVTVTSILRSSCVYQCRCLFDLKWFHIGIYWRWDCKVTKSISK